MPMSVSDARTRMNDYLDDANSRRWDTNARDRHLKAALSKCVTDYAREGGRRFTLSVLAQATSSAGVLSLSSYDPLFVQVAIVDGVYKERLAAVDPADIEQNDDVARTVDVHLVPNIAWNGTTLVNANANVWGPWDAFEEWVVARACLDAARKDKELHASMQRVEEDARAAALSFPDPNPAPDFPSQRSGYGWLGWSIVNKNLQLVKRYGHDYAVGGW